MVEQTELLNIFLQALWDTTPNPVVVVDDAQVICGWNPAALAVFGFNQDEFMGRRITSIIPDFPDVADVESWPSVPQATRPTKIHRTMRTRGLIRSGAEIPIELTVLWILDVRAKVHFALIRDRSVLLEYEQELRESEEKYRSIIQTADDAIISMDEHEAIISWNAGAKRIFGYEEEEVLGRSVQMIIPERFRERHSQGLRRFLETNRATMLGKTMDLAAIRKDGSEFPVELTPSAWKQHGRHFFTAVIRDISARAGMLAEVKAAQSVAEEANRVLRAVFDQMDQGVSVVDAELNMIGCNRRFLELFNFPEHLSRTGMTLEAFIRYNAERGEYGPGDTDAQVRIRLELARKFEPHHYQRTRPDGTTLEVTGTPLAGGGMVTTYTDITERKKAQEAIRHERSTQLKHEQELLESEEKYRTIIQTADDAIVSMDDQETIISWNAGATKIFGYEEDDVLGRSIQLIIPERFRERHSQGLRRFLETERPNVLGKAMELAAVHKDGSEFPVELTPSAWKQHGRYFFTGIIRDISVRARMLSEIQAARTAAEEANRAKSAFISTMSHELRTPLNAIIGYSEMIEEELAEIGGNATTLADVGKIKVAGKHLLGLINTVLNIAKIEAGRMEVMPAHFDIGQLAEQCASLATPLLKQGVVLEKTMDRSVGPVYSDADKVKQIIINLLSNAAKFTHEGRIVLSVRQGLSDQMLAISVADSGIGISEEALGRVFAEFQQADTSITRKYGGTGLGLSISRNLARLLGGDLTASSALGQGSTFTLTIPIEYGAGREAGTSAVS
ncbi:MAG: PAS domain S-box protein [Burkholderiales bacterium]|nr:MAG: PAS domain S-box protein [Burkholderiales bacterium]